MERIYDSGLDHLVVKDCCMLNGTTQLLLRGVYKQKGTILYYQMVQPAVIDPFHDFKQFSTLEKGGRMMVLLNNNYFNMQLPRYMPQLMVLRWRSESNNNAPSQFFKKQFEANFPIDKLKLMIDK